jgi:hypothetical protein
MGVIAFRLPPPLLGLALFLEPFGDCDLSGDLPLGLFERPPLPPLFLPPLGDLAVAFASYLHFISKMTKN